MRVSALASSVRVSDAVPVTELVALVVDANAGYAYWHKNNDFVTDSGSSKLFIVSQDMYITNADAVYAASTQLGGDFVYSDLAAALEAVGATVEIADKDIGTASSGNCSVVIKKLPFMMGRGDRMGVACVIAEAEGCMPANAWKMLDNLPLTFAKNISREEAEEIASKIRERKCTVEIV